MTNNGYRRMAFYCSSNEQTLQSTIQNKKMLRANRDILLTSIEYNLKG